MNKTELVAAVAEQAGLSKKDAEAAVKAFTDVVAVKTRAARIGLNPRTKETIEIPESKVPAFKAGSALKDAVK